MTRLTWGVALASLALLTVWAFAGSGTVDRDRNAEGAAGAVYDPVLAGEPLPSGFRQLLPRDAIAPVYDPRFVDAAEAGWPDDAHVIGVAGGDEAKAYPVSYLNRREMVLDEIAGDAILVSW